MTKSGVVTDAYYMFNIPLTTATTENNCKSPTDCPEDGQGRYLAPWTTVSFCGVNAVVVSSMPIVFALRCTSGPVRAVSILLFLTNNK